MLKPFYSQELIEAGCDEAGRGCLAGPVFAAAVILPKDFKSYKINDSKLLTAEERYKLRKIIIKKALAWSVASIDNILIDKINILNASILAMQNAIAQLKIKPQLLLIDGNRFKPVDNIPHICIIKGDSLYQPIAAASILAKTFRDDYMKQQHNIHPNYSWNSNMGYSTKKHKEAIFQYGYTELHRKSFNINSQMKIEFNED